MRSKSRVTIFFLTFILHVSKDNPLPSFQVHGHYRIQVGTIHANIFNKCRSQPGPSKYIPATLLLIGQSLICIQTGLGYYILRMISPGNFHSSQRFFGVQHACWLNYSAGTRKASIDHSVYMYSLTAPYLCLNDQVRCPNSCKIETLKLILVGSKILIL